MYTYPATELPTYFLIALDLTFRYVKYLYAYESKMNQFSTVDELNMAIAGNRREGRRNKSLLSEYLPSLSGSGHHQHMQQMSPGSSAALHQPQQHQQQQQQGYANMLATEDRFRHLAAVIMDNRQRAAEQACRQQPQSSTSSPPPPPPRSASPQRQGLLSLQADPSPFNGHLQPPLYQPTSMIAAHQAAAGDHGNKQRGKQLFSL